MKNILKVILLVLSCITLFSCATPKNSQYIERRFEIEHRLHAAALDDDEILAKSPVCDSVRRNLEPLIEKDLNQHEKWDLEAVYYSDGSGDLKIVEEPESYFDFTYKKGQIMVIHLVWTGDEKIQEDKINTLYEPQTESCLRGLGYNVDHKEFATIDDKTHEDIGYFTVSLVLSKNTFKNDQKMLFDHSGVNPLSVVLLHP